VLDVNVPGPDGMTPTYAASSRGHLDVVRALASLGAGVNIPADNCVTPVFIAAEKGHLEVVQALASLDADRTLGQTMVRARCSSRGKGALGGGGGAGVPQCRREHANGRRQDVGLHDVC
jgi:ankyrin repeat protein